MSKGTNAKIGVQKASVPDALVSGYAYEDADGDCVQSGAVTLTDACGNEVLGPRPAATSIPVVETSLPSTLHLGKEYPVTATAIQVIPANPFRESGLVQNVGCSNIRVGPAGVTATTGYRLVPNQTIIYGEPNVNKGAIWAIREGTVPACGTCGGGGGDSIAFAQEETIAISDSPNVIEPPDCCPDDEAS